MDDNFVMTSCGPAEDYVCTKSKTCSIPGSGTMCRENSEGFSFWRGCSSSNYDVAGTCVESDWGYSCHCDSDGLVAVM